MRTVRVLLALFLGSVLLMFVAGCFLNKLPVASFALSPITVAPGQTINFIDQSQDADSAVTFGSGAWGMEDFRHCATPHIHPVIRGVTWFI